jgi:hypothetical protein
MSRAKKTVKRESSPHSNAMVNKTNRNWINHIKKASCQSNHSVPEALMRVEEMRRNHREESPRIAVGVA